LDEAYMLLNRTEYPSWLYPVTKGATTIWERWDGEHVWKRGVRLGDRGWEDDRED